MAFKISAAAMVGLRDCVGPDIEFVLDNGPMLRPGPPQPVREDLIPRGMTVATLEWLLSVIVKGPVPGGLPVTSLDCGAMPYILWAPPSETASLDGEFTAEQLEAIAWWMRSHVQPPRPTAAPGESPDAPDEECENKSF